MSIYACNPQFSRPDYEAADADPETIRRYASLLTYPVEFRVVNGPQGTLSGYFDNPDQLAAECGAISGGAGIEAVYTTLNPVNPDLLARSHNRIKNRARHTTSDPDIARRVWLPIDCDAVRPAGISATDEERDEALEVVAAVRMFLAEQGFPAPVLGDSGNGGHALYRVDLPNTPDVAEAIRRLLEHLAKRFDTPRAKLDTKVYNASRVWKVYGTKVQKGDEVGGRRHRLARLLDVPSELEPVPFELIAALAGSAGGAAVIHSAPALPSTAGPILTGMPAEETFARNRRLAEQVVRESGLGVHREKHYAGGVLWVLERCPFCDKADRAAHVAVQPDGKLCFACKHSSCRDKYHWKDFRAAFDPSYAHEANTDLGWIEDMIHEEGQTPVAPTTPRPATSPLPRTKAEKRSNAERLVAAVKEHGELFVTPEDVAHVRRADDSRGETMKVQSAACRRWLVDLGVRLGFVPGGKALADAQLALEAAAFSNKTVRRVYLRFARLGDTLFVDLADPDGRMVEVTASGWRVVAGSPVAFVRPPNLAPLPVPERGGNLSELRSFLNVAEEEFPLVRGFILDCYKGVGPYTVLLINGEQGSAKSTATKILRQLIDPVHKAPARRLQRDEYDLAVAALKNAVLFFDNVSSLPQWLSDAIASLATGSGFAVRTLYSQDDETVYGDARPVCFNGIPDFAESSDLLDRAIRLTLPRIPDRDRKSEDEFEPLFDAARPRLLGAILDAVSAGLRNYDTLKLDALPRMARSARWIAACEAGLPPEDGSFTAAYTRNREELNVLAVDNSPVATALLAWLDRIALPPGRTWEGSASKLHDALLDVVSGLVATSTGFPKAPNKLSGELRRLAPVLARVGVHVALGRTKRGSCVTVQREAATGDGPAASPVSPVTEAGDGLRLVLPRDRQPREVAHAVAA